MEPKSGGHGQPSAIAALLASLAEPESELQRELRVGAERLSPGDRIGDFTLLRRLGGGGMGEVFEAEQAVPRRRVAVKVLHPECLSEAGVRRLRAEATLLARSSHPGIVEVYSAGIATAPSGLPMAYMAMELVELGVPITLAACRSEAPPVEQTIGLFLQLVDAVSHAHSIGIIHLDLKPTNALVDRRGTVKLIDFGLARAAEGVVPRTDCPSGATGWIGTYEYMAPEQFALAPDGCDARADVYSLGVILFELLALQRPHNLSGLSPFGIGRLLSQTPPPSLLGIRPNAPAWIANITAKCLEPIPGMRYPTALELASDIRRGLSGAVTTASHPRAIQRMVRWTRLNARRLLVAAAVLVGAVALVIGATTLRRSNHLLADAESRIQAAVLRDASAAIPRGQLQLAAMYAREAKFPAWETEAIAAIASKSLISLASNGPIRTAGFVANGGSLLLVDDSGAWVIDLRKLGLPDEQRLHLSASATSARFVRGNDSLVILREGNSTFAGYSITDGHKSWEILAADISPSDTGEQIAVLDPTGVYVTNCNQPDAGSHRLLDSTDGSSIIWEGDDVYVGCRDGRIAKLNASNGSCTWLCPEQPELGWYRLVFSPAGLLRVSSAKGLEALANGAWSPFPNPSVGPSVTGASLSPDRTKLAIGAAVGSFAIVDIATGDLSCITSAHPDRTGTVAWSPDGRYLLTASTEGRAKVWPTNPLAICPRSDGIANLQQQLSAVDLTADGCRAALSDGARIRVALLRPEFLEIANFVAPGVTSVAISPLGDRVAWLANGQINLATLESPVETRVIQAPTVSNLGWIPAGLLSWSKEQIDLIAPSDGTSVWRIRLEDAVKSPPTLVRATDTLAVFLTRENSRTAFACSTHDGAIRSALNAEATGNYSVAGADYLSRSDRWYWFDDFGVAHASPEFSRAGEGLRNLETHAGVASRFTSGEERLLAVSEHGQVCVLIPETLELTAWLEAAPIPAKWATLSSDGDVLTIATATGLMRQYHAPSPIRQPPYIWRPDFSSGKLRFQRVVDAK